MAKRGYGQVNREIHVIHMTGMERVAHQCCMKYRARGYRAGQETGHTGESGDTGSSGRGCTPVKQGTLGWEGEGAQWANQERVHTGDSGLTGRGCTLVNQDTGSSVKGCTPVEKGHTSESGDTGLAGRGCTLVNQG
ncbi:hypothetical protein BaRGS_00025515 [Batillaria attramentaria]|uniref:Uncharacterized protein n=1 Tax=Batillaria attramentaria TaxID=370345 RepID=A0ABD0K811_9CAEN